jgi:Spy/CpxP family protein refolding chaperone
MGYEKRIALGAVILPVLLITTLAAQDWGEMPGPPPGGPERSGSEARLVRLLGLTEQQASSLAEMRKEQREAARPLWQEQRQIGEQLRKALESAAPDPLAVGQAAIALHASRGRLKALDDRFHRRLMEILDSQQQKKLELLEEMRPHAPGPPEPPPTGDRQ